jgi:hypothetical protein
MAVACLAVLVLCGIADAAGAPRLGLRPCCTGAITTADLLAPREDVHITAPTCFSYIEATIMITMHFHAVFTARWLWQVNALMQH